MTSSNVPGGTFPDGNRFQSLERAGSHRFARVGVLLMHGLGGTPNELRLPARALARSGFAVNNMTLAGHCQSADDLRRSTWSDWVASVDIAYDELRRSCDVVIAGGLSMGAILAVELAHRRPDEVIGLILLAPTLRLDGWAMPYSSRFVNLIRPGLVPFDLELREREPYGIKDPRIRAIVLRCMQSGEPKEAGTFATPLRAFAQFNGLVAHTRRLFGTVRQPALIIHPRHDDIAAFGNATELQRRLAGPVETIVLEDSYHLVTLDRQRHEVVAQCAAFASRIAAGYEQGPRPLFSGTRV